MFHRLTQKVNYNFDYTNSLTDTIMTIWIWQISLTQPLIKPLIKVSAKSRDTLNTSLNVYKKHINHDLILCMDVINTSTILQRNITRWHPRDFEIRSWSPNWYENVKLNENYHHAKFAHLISFKI